LPPITRRRWFRTLFVPLYTLINPQDGDLAKTRIEAVSRHRLSPGVTIVIDRARLRFDNELGIDEPPNVQHEFGWIGADLSQNRKGSESPLHWRSNAQAASCAPAEIATTYG
jgi:hypothetical protein